MIYCSRCGTANRDGSRYCNQCGERLSHFEPCPSCGYPNLGGVRFCNNCGLCLDQPVTPAADVVQPPVAEPPIAKSAIVEPAVAQPETAEPNGTQPAAVDAAHAPSRPRGKKASKAFLEPEIVEDKEESAAPGEMAECETGSVAGQAGPDLPAEEVPVEVEIDASPSGATEDELVGYAAIEALLTNSAPGLEIGKAGETAQPVQSSGFAASARKEAVPAASQSESLEQVESEPGSDWLEQAEAEAESQWLEQAEVESGWPEEIEAASEQEWLAEAEAGPESEWPELKWIDRREAPDAELEGTTSGQTASPELPDVVGAPLGGTPTVGGIDATDLDAIDATYAADAEEAPITSAASESAAASVVPPPTVAATAPVVDSAVAIDATASAIAAEPASDVGLAPAQTAAQEGFVSSEELPSWRIPRGGAGDGETKIELFDIDDASLDLLDESALAGRASADEGIVVAASMVASQPVALPQAIPSPFATAGATFGAVLAEPWLTLPRGTRGARAARNIGRNNGKGNGRGQSDLGQKTEKKTAAQHGAKLLLLLLLWLVIAVLIIVAITFVFRNGSPVDLPGSVSSIHLLFSPDR